MEMLAFGRIGAFWWLRALRRFVGRGGRMRHLARTPIMPERVPAPIDGSQVGFCARQDA